MLPGRPGSADLKDRLCSRSCAVMR